MAIPLRLCGLSLAGSRTRRLARARAPRCQAGAGGGRVRASELDCRVARSTIGVGLSCVGSACDRRNLDAHEHTHGRKIYAKSAPASLGFDRTRSTLRPQAQPQAVVGTFEFCHWRITGDHTIACAQVPLGLVNLYRSDELWTSRREPPRVAAACCGSRAVACAVTSPTSPRAV
eukprot:4778841-Prymnesium_polylepis.1